MPRWRGAARPARARAARCARVAAARLQLSACRTPDEHPSAALWMIHHSACRVCPFQRRSSWTPSTASCPASGRRPPPPRRARCSTCRTPSWWARPPRCRCGGAGGACGRRRSRGCCTAWGGAAGRAPAPAPRSSPYTTRLPATRPPASLVLRSTATLTADRAEAQGDEREAGPHGGARAAGHPVQVRLLGWGRAGASTVPEQPSLPLSALAAASVRALPALDGSPHLPPSCRTRPPAPQAV